MKVNKWGLAGFAVAASFSAGIALADTSSIDGTSTTTATNPARALSDIVTLSYWGNYSGPEVINPTRLNPDASANPGKYGSQNLDGYFYGGYRITPDIYIGGLFAQQINPLAEKSFTIEDPALYMADTRLMHTANFNLFADFRGYIPTSTTSQGDGMITGVRFSQLGIYTIPKSRWSVGWYSFIRGNFLGPSAVADANAYYFEYYFAPLAMYQITQKVAFSFFSELVQYQHQAANDQYTYLPFDVEPGISIDLTKNLNLNPYVNFFPSSSDILGTTYLGMTISAKIL